MKGNLDMLTIWIVVISTVLGLMGIVIGRGVEKEMLARWVVSALFSVIILVFMALILGATPEPHDDVLTRKLAWILLGPALAFLLSGVMAIASYFRPERQ